MPEYKTYPKEAYLKGNPELNLLLNERRLVLTALKRSNWSIKKAFKLNYPLENITLNAYNYVLLRHQINAREKTFTKISEMN